MFCKKIILLFCCFLFLFSSSIIRSSAQSQTSFDYEEQPVPGTHWERKGFEFFIGGSVYFASKKTANYYNGAPENDINLNLLLKNKFQWDDIIHNLLRPKYNADTMILREDYNSDSRYSVAMDISLGARYRFKPNWYFELIYSFRRVNCGNKFIFDNPYGIPGNKDNPPYSDWEYLSAKEDRHSIDFSVGYIFHKHAVVKPFLSLGAQFNYIRIKEFVAIIENKPFDLMYMARNPNHIPGVQDETYLMDWAGPGYGFLLTAGIKIAFSKLVSLDPVFQLSAASFGNSSRLPGFNTGFCFNYIAGVRLVVNDGFFARNR
jgi:hypothetical protein